MYLSPSEREVLLPVSMVVIFSWRCSAYEMLAFPVHQSNVISDAVAATALSDNSDLLDMLTDTDCREAMFALVLVMTNRNVDGMCLNRSEVLLPL